MSPAKPKILAVDNRPANLLALRKVLARVDARLIEADNGNDALALCLDHEFALILVDVDMPGMDGYELAELLRGEPKTAHVPLIFVTASCSDDIHRRRGYGVGAVEYIQKPVDDFILRSKVGVFLELYLARKGLEAELARSEAMAASLREGEARLRVSEQKFRNLVENTADMIWEVDCDGRLTYVSPRSLDLLGLDPAALEGRTLVSLCRPEDASRLGLALLGGSHRMELVLEAADGGRVHTECSMLPFHDADGALIGYRGITRDISIRRKVQAELARKTADLERSNADLEQFAYVASHDLREPLRMVNSFLGLLERRILATLDDECREFIAFAKDGARRMDHLILDLLDYARIGRNAPPERPVPLGRALETALANLTVALTESGAEVTVPAGMPDLCVDEVEFVRLFQNLIANAVKYRHPDRPPRIRILVGHADEEWSFAVEDNGIGIEPQYFDRIFQIFQRLHVRGEADGTGIGLAVCKRVVNRYRGRIWVESVPGQGCRFRFTVPDAPGA
ncbi:ATP-binding protein [Magnetospirillum sp. SS-4]|uniref:sensor histidine kinase n=1 Tax=Magnetospirillum sp. SS-4 TaxID=2681465 RepID=UPI001383080A|nr:ATP-binding protein [Magnetospirillum sp. SS-4]CAA7614408.1 Signal transduction histidine kinase [Magnetospirillum sp. SS-4]